MSSAVPLATLFPATSAEEYVRKFAERAAPRQPVVPDVIDEVPIEQLLRELGYDTVNCDIARLPRNPPNKVEWQHHLNQLTTHMQRRSFQQDADDLVQAFPAWGEPACANGPKCVGMTCHGLISGLTDQIILRPISVSPGVVHHAQLCVLCHRAKVRDLLLRDTYRTGFVNEASELSRPGPEPHQHKTLTPLQTFWNPRDEFPDGYSSHYMCQGRDGDLIVMPVVRLSLSALRAERMPEIVEGGAPVSYRWRIVQDALRYIIPSNAVIRPPVPGETVTQMLDRNKRLMSTASQTAHRDERNRFVHGFLFPHHRWVTRAITGLWRENDDLKKEPKTSVLPLLKPCSWDINLHVLDRYFFAPPAAYDEEVRMALCHLTDASLHVSRLEHTWVAYAQDAVRLGSIPTLKWDVVCFDRILDPALHGYVEEAAYFGPLSDVRSSIGRQFTKNGVTQRCQQRNSKGMAIKKIIIREMERARQRGTGNKVVAVHRYQGYVLRTCKALMLCSLKGDYALVGHQNRPLEHELRRRLQAIFTEPRYERWAVKLIHQCNHLLTASVREFMCYSIRNNPPLYAHVHDLMQLDAYQQITETALNETRAYFRRYLLGNPKEPSDLFQSFAKLPIEPAYLQHYYVCGSPRCSLPCPHKFMKTKEAKKAVAPNPHGTASHGCDEETMFDELAEDVERDIVQAMSKDWGTVTVRHRQEEVGRERVDTDNERASGWRWKADRFHKHLNAVFNEMDLRASDISYSRPWKLVVLFRPVRKRRAPAPKGDGSSLANACVDVPPSHRHLLTRIVEGCGPVRCGDVMSRVLRFFPLLGVDVETTSMLMDLMVRFRDATTTENKLQEIMTCLTQHRPYAHALLQCAYNDIKTANDHHFTTVLPYHIAYHQLEALHAVYGGAVLTQSACFVFCPGCGHIYTHLMDASTMYAKVFRFGLRNAESDPHTGKLTCRRHITTRIGSDSRCRHELVQIPLIGRALFYKNKVIMICPQPRCARFMVLDNHDRHYTAWTDHGPACSMCMPLMLPTVNILRKMDTVYLNKSNEQGQCCLREAHEQGAPKRASASQLIVLMHGVVVCKKHYHPDMAERALTLWTSMYGKVRLFDLQEKVREAAHDIHTTETGTAQQTQRKRHRQLMDRASNGGRRRKRTRVRAEP